MGERSHLGNLGARNAVGGEIVEVEGGHIIKSTGRKDRHSKVCTAKGPRDRRVRLAAQTAIQFYDVQDRLGYDRPSKAVDWLIKNAKAAIDELAELPPWKPTNADLIIADERQEQHGIHQADLIIADVLGPSRKKEMAMLDYNVNEASSSSMQFQNYPAPDFLSKSSTYSQDLRLSLQSFHDPVQAQVFLGTPPSFDSFQEHHPQSLGSWNPGEDSIGGSGVAAATAGYVLNPPTGSQQLLGQHQLYSQRGTLQSSNSPSFRAWVDPSAIPFAYADHNTHSAIWPMYPSSMSSIGFASGVGGFSEFHIPARIQGDQEKQVGYPNNPSSASSDPPPPSLIRKAGNPLLFR